MATAAEIRHIRIVNAETKTVELICTNSIEEHTISLALLNFTEEEQRMLSSWLQEFTETGRCVKCIEERLVSGVFDGDDERKERIEAALQNNLRRMEELSHLLQDAKVRIVHAWQRIVSAS